MRLCVCPSAYLRNYSSSIHQIFYAFYLYVWLGLRLAALRYVMYFRFMDDVMFCHNGPMEACRYCSSDAADSNVPRCLMRPILEDGGHQDESFLRGVPGAESAMRHCLVQ